MRPATVTFMADSWFHRPFLRWRTRACPIRPSLGLARHNSGSCGPASVWDNRPHVFKVANIAVFRPATERVCLCARACVCSHVSLQGLPTTFPAQPTEFSRVHVHRWPLETTVSDGELCTEFVRMHAVCLDLRGVCVSRSLARDNPSPSRARARAGWHRVVRQTPFCLHRDRPAVPWRHGGSCWRCTPCAARPGTSTEAARLIKSGCPCV